MLKKKIFKETYKIAPKPRLLNLGIFTGSKVTAMYRIGLGAGKEETLQGLT